MSVRLIIVTICFNNLEELKRTCLSVDQQRRLPDEHWIVNGSTSAEISDWLSSLILPSYRFVINELDSGISDAFNKGIKAAGEGFVQLLNSGDELIDTFVLHRIEEFLEANPEIEWASGRITLEGGQEVGVPFEFDKLYQGMRWVAHPSWWVNRKTYNICGPYEERYKIAMDFDMLCRLAEFQYGFYDFTSVRFDGGGVSSVHYFKGLREVRAIYRRRVGFAVRVGMWQFRLIVSRWIQSNQLGRYFANLYRSKCTKIGSSFGRTPA